MFVCSLLLPCMLKSTVLRVGVKALFNQIHLFFGIMPIKLRNAFSWSDCWYVNTESLEVKKLILSQIYFYSHFKTVVSKKSGDS